MRHIYKLGNVKDNSLEEIWNSETLKKIQDIRKDILYQGVKYEKILSNSLEGDSSKAELPPHIHVCHSVTAVYH